MQSSYVGAIRKTLFLATKIWSDPSKYIAHAAMRRFPVIDISVEEVEIVEYEDDCPTLSFSDLKYHHHDHHHHEEDHDVVSSTLSSSEEEKENNDAMYFL